jgi:hypothetical protein
MPDKAGYPHVGEREPVANEKQPALLLLQRGTATWNEWRAHNPEEKIDLSGAKLSGDDLINANLRGANLIRANLHLANLSGADLSGADLSRAFLINSILRGTNLQKANLSGAELSDAILGKADLTNANLREANLGGADLSGADLSGASLGKAKFSGADLSEANLSRASLSGTIFSNIDLGKTTGLDKCTYWGPSFIDFQTLSRSGNLPISFLRGCGLPDNLIDYLPSLRGDAIQFYSCFISYSGKDQMFADRLHADLQNKGVRCWFAPHDLPIGAKIWDAIDEAIRVREKLLVILSEASITSGWVGDEVNKAYAEERKRKETILFPIRIDNVVMTTTEPWASKLRDQRNIGDFRQWKKPAEYQKILDRLLRDLKASGAK